MALLMMGLLAACGATGPPTQNETGPTTVAELDRAAVAAQDPVTADIGADIAPPPLLPVLTTEEPTEDDVVAAAQAFVRVYNHMLATGDYSRLEAHCHPQASFCRALVGGAKGRGEAGAKVVGGDLTVQDGHVESLDEIRNIWVTGMPYELRAGEIQYEDGEVIPIAASKGNLRVEVTHWPSRGWLLRELAAEEPPAE